MKKPPKFLLYKKIPQYRCRLMAMRHKHYITQENLAKTLGVSRQTISSIERNQSEPSLELAVKLAKYFHATIEEMFIYREH